MCIITRILGFSSAFTSITQTAIVSIDRYHASLPLQKSVVFKRRRKLGIISIAVNSSVFVLIIIFITVQWNNFLCKSETFYGRPTTIVSGVVLLYLYA